MMSNYNLIAKSASLSLSIALLSACGGGGGSDTSTGTGTSAPQTGSVSFGFSDAPVPALSSVIITVDKITVNRTGEDIVIDRFTSADLDIDDAETFTLDLLEVQGMDNKIVVDLVELPAGDYQNLRIEVLDEDTNMSYVMETDTNLQKIIKVPSDELKLGGFTVTAGGVQTIMIEFGLRDSMTYNPGPDRYILKPRGVRVVDVAAAAAIDGTVAVASFQANPDCMDSDSAPLPLDGYAIYAYQGHGLEVAKLADSFDPEVEQENTTYSLDMIAPFASTTIAVDEDTGIGSFMFPYFPAGDYTLAFSCAAGVDDADQFDGISIPLPAGLLTETTLTSGAMQTCSFDADTKGSCAL